jgi:hypothetical protein
MMLNRLELKIPIKIKIRNTNSIPIKLNPFLNED